MAGARCGEAETRGALETCMVLWARIGKGKARDFAGKTTRTATYTLHCDCEDGFQRRDFETVYIPKCMWHCGGSEHERVPSTSSSIALYKAFGILGGHGRSGTAARMQFSRKCAPQHEEHRHHLPNLIRLLSTLEFHSVATLPHG